MTRARSMSTMIRLAAVTGAMTLLCSCGSKTAASRAQLLVVVDTDAPTVGQVVNDQALSKDAAVDTVRVDVIDASGREIVFREFVAPDAADWPLSFGLIPSEGGASTVRLRVRAFQGQYGTPGVENGVATLDPPQDTAIDRLVDLTFPTEGVSRARVLLASDCRAQPVRFTKPPATCVSKTILAGAPAQGIETLAEGQSATSVGTWPPARESVCSLPTTQDRVCIPGGFLVLGDRRFTGTSDGVGSVDPTPLLPTIVSSFMMDKVEVTVARFRTLSPSITAALPLTSVAGCTYTTEPGPNESFPVNCVTLETARQACEAAGGKLPTEAQWEHAARGRGQARRFPWGSLSPVCCRTSIARNNSGVCMGSGAEPVGSHTGEGCDGVGDSSRDGVLDLGGNVSELTRDAFRGYDDPCWGIGGVLLDPYCAPGPDDHVQIARGGAWSQGAALAAGSFRQSFGTNDPDYGFRCVYAASVP